MRGVALGHEEKAAVPVRAVRGAARAAAAAAALHFGEPLFQLRRAARSAARSAAARPAAAARRRPFAQAAQRRRARGVGLDLGRGELALELGPDRVHAAPQVHEQLAHL